MGRTLITGSDGLIGSALKRLCGPDDDMYFATRQDADLTYRDDVYELYKKTRPEFVIHAAAKVGGIGANLRQPAELFYQNILMNSYMIHFAQEFGVKKMICFSSLCTFPYENVDIFKENLQQAGEPFSGNFAYGYAKRMIDVQIRAYRQQYGVKYCAMILSNAYGPHDNWNLDDGHVIPNLIHKCYLSKQEGKPMTIWGDGSAQREFVYSLDAAQCAIAVLNSDVDVDKVIVSGDEGLLTIKQVCDHICECIGFDGEIIYDKTKPNGRQGCPSDAFILRKIVPEFKFTPTQDGIKETVNWFVDHYPNVRK